jgi:hypothetical protein
MCGTVLAVKRTVNQTALLIKDVDDYKITSSDFRHDFKIGDTVKIEEGNIYWSREGEFKDKRVRKISASKSWYA